MVWGSLLVETSPSNAEGVGLIPDQRAKITDKKPKLKTEAKLNKFNKNLKNEKECLFLENDPIENTDYNSKLLT